MSRSNSDLDGGGSSSDKGMMAVGVDVEFVAVVSMLFFGCFPVGDSSSHASLRLLAVEGMSGAAMSRWETTFPASDGVCRRVAFGLWTLDGRVSSPQNSHPLLLAWAGAQRAPLHTVAFFSGACCA